MNTEDKDRIDALRKKYKDPDNIEFINELEERIKRVGDLKQWNELQISKNIIAYLRERIVDMRRIKAMTKGLSPEELMSYDARMTECEMMLNAIAVYPEREYEAISSEMNRFLRE